MAVDAANPLAAVRREAGVRHDARPRRRRLDRDERLSLREGFRSNPERSRVLGWLEAGLRPGRPGRLASEYPLLRDEAGPARHFTLFAEGLPLAHCLLVPRRIALLGGALPVAFLSLVYTDPRARGRGHAGRVVRAAVRFARDSGIGLVLLWSEADDLYAREGFEPAGRETLLPLDETVLERALERTQRSGSQDPRRATPGMTIAPARACDWEAIEAIRSQRDARVVCDASERARRPGLPDLDARVARGEDGRVLGFAMRGRGDDLREVIHEWGGELEATLRCCHALVADDRSPPSVMLLAPAHRTELAWACRQAGARVLTRPLAWMRIASRPALAEALVGIGLDADGLGLHSGQDEGSSTARVWPARSERRAVTQAELLERLFGPPDSKDPARPGDAFGTASGSIPTTGLPLPLFVWGLESI